MGVYTKDELEDRSFGIGPDNAVDVTPKNPAPLDDINEQIKAEKASQTKPKPSFDADTGGVIDQAGAGDSSPPEVKPADPKPAPLPCGWPKLCRIGP